MAKRNNFSSVSTRKAKTPDANPVPPVHMNNAIEMNSHNIHRTYKLSVHRNFDIRMDSHNVHTYPEFIGIAI